jgi:hypothetical protein
MEVIKENIKHQPVRREFEEITDLHVEAVGISEDRDEPVILYDNELQADINLEEITDIKTGKNPDLRITDDFNLEDAILKKNEKNISDGQAEPVDVTAISFEIDAITRVEAVKVPEKQAVKLPEKQVIKVQESQAPGISDNLLDDVLAEDDFILYDFDEKKKETGPPAAESAKFEHIIPVTEDAAGKVNEAPKFEHAISDSGSVTEQVLEETPPVHIIPVSVKEPPAIEKVIPETKILPAKVSEKVESRQIISEKEDDLLQVDVYEFKAEKDEMKSESLVSGVPGEIMADLPESLDISDLEAIDLKEAERIANENMLVLSENDLIEELKDIDLIFMNDRGADKKKERDNFKGKRLDDAGEDIPIVKGEADIPAASAAFTEGEAGGIIKEDDDFQAVKGIDDNIPADEVLLDGDGRETSIIADYESQAETYPIEKNTDSQAADKIKITKIEESVAEGGITQPDSAAETEEQEQHKKPEVVPSVPEAGMEAPEGHVHEMPAEKKQGLKVSKVDASPSDYENLEAIPLSLLNAYIIDDNVTAESKLHREKEKTDIEIDSSRDVRGQAGGARILTEESTEAYLYDDIAQDEDDLIVEKDLLAFEEILDDGENSIPADAHTGAVRPDDFGGDSIDQTPISNISDKVILLESKSELDRFINSMPEDKKNNLRMLLKYLDGLFEKLPEDIIRKFADSEYYNLYIQILEDME